MLVGSTSIVSRGNGQISSAMRFHSYLEYEPRIFTRRWKKAIKVISIFSPFCINCRALLVVSVLEMSVSSDSAPEWHPGLRPCTRIEARHISAHSP